MIPSRHQLGGRVNRNSLIRIATLIVAGIAIDAYAIHQRAESSQQFEQEVQAARSSAAKIQANIVVSSENRVPARGNFAAALETLGLSAQEAATAATAAAQVFNLRQLRAGNTITVGRSVEGSLKEIDYKIDPNRVLRILPQDQGFSAEVKAIASHLEVVAVSGTLEDSLFNAVEDAGESPEVAMKLAQIFAYDMDFYTDPRKGDTFRVVLEKKKYYDGKPAGYGKILAAEYKNGGHNYDALLFHDPDGKPAYYTMDGKSLQKVFLRSPLKFGAPITSHFSKSRFHPVLKIYRPHLGTDYGAPTGTPVQTIGSGRVIFAGRKGGDGNMVHVVHTNGYETMYLHLSKMFVRNGEHVEIGKTIGLVGSTGLATGPHLDFRILQKGQFKNFEKLGLPPSDPVAKRNMPEFGAVREKWLPVLKGRQTLDASTAEKRISSVPYQ
jgi:murein DD-endopeptidase MepM/ murein hydrolase activator NlpD